MEKINTFNKLKNNIEIVSILKKKDLRYIDDNKIYDVYLSLLGKKGFLRVIRKLLGNKRYILMPNLFPYSKIVHNIPYLVHYVLWSKKELNNNQISNIIEEKFSNKKYVFIERKHKSLPEIKHWQVFVLNI